MPQHKRYKRCYSKVDVLYDLCRRGPLRPKQNGFNGRRTYASPGTWKVKNAGPVNLVDQTFSDIFDELAFPSKPFHDGFGLLTLHGVPKPIYRAFQLGTTWVTRTRIQSF